MKHNIPQYDRLFNIAVTSSAQETGHWAELMLPLLIDK